MTTTDRETGWGLGFASPVQSTPRKPSMRTIPSTDAIFAAFAERRFDALSEWSPAQFERALRGVFPRASVRPCELAFAQEAVWYVYREGRWVPPRGRAWWLNRGLPRVVVDGDGFIVESNRRPSRVGGGEGVVGRHVMDFAVDGSFDELLEMAGPVGTATAWTATIQFRLGGVIRVAEIHAERTSDGNAALVIRPASAPPFLDVPGIAPLRPELSCLPPRDRLFAAYARVLLDRMADPSPGGLELRIRRLYPAATVCVYRAEPATDPVPVWECRRDDREPLPDGWWREPGLPTVVLDERSCIRSASPELQALLGDDLVGRSWQEFTAAGEVPDAEAATAVLLELGATETAYLPRDRAGRVHPFDAWLSVENGLLTAILRPR